MEKKVMSDYTCYCTAEQTKKALELGAPIETFGFESIAREMIECAKELDEIASTEKWLNSQNATMYRDSCYSCPTAEQMIGFLRSKGVEFLLSDEPDTEGCYWHIGISEDSIACGKEKENKELAAIDAALEYLSNEKIKH